MAIAAALGRLVSMRQAVHGVTITAGQPGRIMHIRQHLQEGLAIYRYTTLITHVVFARCSTGIVPADKIPPVATLTGTYRWLGNGMSRAMAIQTPLNMAGIAVFAIKIAVHLGIAALHKAAFACAGDHGMFKNLIMSLVTGYAANSTVFNNCRITHRIALAQMTGKTGKRRMGTLLYNLVAVLAVFAFGYNCIRHNEPANSDEEHHPAHVNQVLSGRSGCRPAMSGMSKVSLKNKKTG